VPWFKVHDDVLTDPKLCRYFSKQERWDWIGLLTLANKSRERGVVRSPDDEIAYALDLSDDEWASLCAKFQERRMVARRALDGALVIVNWAARQYDKPSDRPAEVRERVRHHRETGKAADPQQRPDTLEPGAETPCNAPVTPCNAASRDETPQLRQEQQQQTRAAAAAAAQTRRAGT